MYCIVVPHYQKCTEEDIKLLGEIQKLYYDIDLFIVTFRNCDLSGISQDYKIKYFDKDFFRSVSSYNRLMLNKNFYESFGLYAHMMIIQYDVSLNFRIRDLRVFTSDFVGAPCYFNEKFIGLNGGYSIRNVEACKRVLQSKKRFVSFRKCIDSSRNILFAIGKYFLHRSIVYWVINEDIVFSELLGYDQENIELYAQFSQEKNSEYLTKKYGIPTGYHAGNKYL